MEPLQWIPSALLTLAVAAAGAWLATRLRIKAGALVGALVAVTLLSLFSGFAYLPVETKVIAQLVAGSVIGASVSRRDLGEFRQAAAPSLVFLFLMILIGLLLGTGLSVLYGMDWLTAMFTTVPGGMTEMTIISLEMGADVSVVVLFQLVRLFSTILLAPLLIPKVARILGKRQVAARESGNVQPAVERVPMTIQQVHPFEAQPDLLPADLPPAEFLQPGAESGTQTAIWKRRAIPLPFRIPIAVIASALAGLGGQAAGFPGGALTFSMIAMIFLNVRFNLGAMPRQAKRFAQTLSGAYIGCQVTAAVAMRLPSLLAPMAFITIGFFVLSLSAGYLIHRVFRVDLLTALFSSAPAGASDMALISMEFDAAGSQVTLFHTVRLIGVIAMAPPIIRLLAK